MGAVLAGAHPELSATNTQEKIGFILQILKLFSFLPFYFLYCHFILTLKLKATILNLYPALY